jgi:hypothetical protein
MSIFKIIGSLFTKSKGTSVDFFGAEEASNDFQNLMVVLRPGNWSSGKDIALVPMEIAKTTTNVGKEVGLEVAWFSFIGDMHVRFVYDSPTFMKNLSVKEFNALLLTPEEALSVAISNIKRVYGLPKASPLEGSLMLVKSKSADLDSSYFLDSAFWQIQLKKHPEGLVVGVPERGGLLFVPISNSKEVEGFSQSIGAIFTSSEEKLRISSALYLFKDNRWSVFQEPMA